MAWEDSLCIGLIAQYYITIKSPVGGTNDASGIFQANLMLRVVLFFHESYQYNATTQQ